MKDDRQSLSEQYDRALDEYRFQVKLNWSRIQYLLALNVGIISVGAGLLEVAAPFFVLMVFFMGAFVALLSLVVTSTQESYYRAARDLKGKLEDALSLGPHAIRTTPGMGGRKSGMARAMKVRTALKITFAIMGVINVFGLGFSLSRTLS